MRESLIHDGLRCPGEAAQRMTKSPWSDVGKPAALKGVQERMGVWVETGYVGLVIER